MTLVEVRRSWLATIAALASIQRDGTPPDPAELMTVFDAEVAMKLGAGPTAFETFLADAYRAYCAVSATLGLRGWFYAWYDEISGTLRCSVADIAVVSELPFACQTDVREDAAAVASAIANSGYTGGIPASELEQTEWVDPRPGDSILILPVYARQLVRPLANEAAHR